jgi:hypothetical protein
MLITTKGWSRNAGDNIILEQPIEITIKPDSYSPSGPPHVRTLTRKPNEVYMNVGPVRLSLSGRYEITVRFTDEDIARLFLLAHPEFRAAVEAIYAKPEPTPTEAPKNQTESRADGAEVPKPHLVFSQPIEN